MTIHWSTLLNPKVIDLVDIIGWWFVNSCAKDPSADGYCGEGAGEN